MGILDVLGTAVRAGLVWLGCLAPDRPPDPRCHTDGSRGRRHTSLRRPRSWSPTRTLDLRETAGTTRQDPNGVTTGVIDLGVFVVTTGPTG